MESRKIDKTELRNYLGLLSEMAGYEAKLYESIDDLEKNELKISELIERQNKIRYNEDQEDLFREQLEPVIRLLADNYEEFGFDYRLYFDLVYNLMFLEYNRVIRMDQEDQNVSVMLEKIGIDEEIKQKAKAVLTHRCGGECE